MSEPFLYCPLLIVIFTICLVMYKMTCREKYTMLCYACNLALKCYFMAEQKNVPDFKTISVIISCQRTTAHPMNKHSNQVIIDISRSYMSLPKVSTD